MPRYEIACMDCRAVTGWCEVEHSTGLCERCLQRRYPIPISLARGAVLLPLAMGIVFAAIVVLWLVPDALVASWFLR